MPDATTTITPIPVPAAAPPAPAPPVQTPAAKPPDALLIPTDWVDGLAEHEKKDMLCTYAEDLLGGDRPNGITAHIRLVTPKQWFATLNYNDTLYHEYGHPREKKSRYVWTDLEGGAKQGVLTADATPAKPMGRQPASDEPANPIARMAAELKRKAATRAR